MATANDSPQINATPTKRLVVFVITKDIRLEDAILDLIDNSIDGARRNGSPSKLAGFHVEIEADSKKFVIKDNCGGMPIALARDYAFRFGRPKDYTLSLDGTKKQIGNFGIGMKRALLKMGKKINIKSATKSEYFEVDIDVDKWLEDDTDWTFAFKQQGKAKAGVQNTGTIIEVTDLYPGVAERFALADFHTSLKLLIRDKEVNSLNSGLSIVLNNLTVDADDVTLLQSGAIKPIYFTEQEEFSVGKVQVKLYAGLSESDNNHAGWYIICNGRTIIRADRSDVTGWGVKAGSDKIASFHNQYARFRGYLYFDSDHPSLLPWNTTKTGVDVEHPLYRKYRLEMISVMRDVFQFLKDLDNEKDAVQRPLHAAVEKAKSAALSSVKPSAKFVRPTGGTKAAKEDALTWIRYQRASSEVTSVTKNLGVAGPKEAGEATFDLYFNSLGKGKK
jgi:hypothetical protein